MIGGKKLKNYSLLKKKMFEAYGNTYTKTDVCLIMIVLISAAFSVCYMQKLNAMYTCVILITVLVFFPILITSYFKYRKEKIKFEEYCLYFESMKMYFKVYGKLITALKETYKAFSKTSSMALCIEQAMEEIEESGDYAAALFNIDKQYHNTYLERLHSLLITGEKQGGDSVYYNIDAICYEEWKTAMNLFQKKKRSVKYMFYLMAILSLAISVYSVLAYQDDTLMNALVKNTKYQMYTFLELEILLVLFFYIYISLVNKKWVRSDE